jgi:uncharacterized iron-regulated membrane protein
MVSNTRRKGRGVLRIFRKLHNISGLVLAVFILLMAVTGILLGWKKNSFEYLVPKTQTGTSTDLSKWLPLDSLHTLAVVALAEFVSPDLLAEVDRIDVRKNSGIVKFDFKHHYYGIQIDGTTGQILDVGVRRSDFIENLHDGTFFDKYFKTRGEIIKLIYTSLIGLAMVMFTLTGIYIHVVPRRNKKRHIVRRISVANKSESGL